MVWKRHEEQIRPRYIPRIQERDSTLSQFSEPRTSTGEEQEQSQPQGNPSEDENGITDRDFGSESNARDRKSTMYTEER